MAYKPLPIGIDDFEKLISKGYYYVDKTWLISELLEKKGEVNLFTRPRRFGKSLNLSMLRYFFEDAGTEEKNADRRGLFRGLQVMKADDGVLSQMNRYPVIQLSLKSAKLRDKDCKVVRRKGRVYVINKKNPRMKARQG